MITVDIGSNGRLGNQMFQYAALVGIATKQNLAYGLDYSYASNDLTWDQFGVDDSYVTLAIDKPFDLSAEHTEVEYPIVQEQQWEFHFQEKFFEVGDNIKLRGYFQTYRYFDHCTDLIRKEFTFKKEIVAAANSFLKDKQSQPTVSIHVRRGDYVELAHHGLCDISYYTNAISTYFSDKPYNFIVVTDDVEWAKSTFVGGDNFFVSETYNQYVDMCIMSLCNHNIIANSTFSWWGSWLNQNPDKLVVAPSVWFRDCLSHLETKDVCLPTWKKI